MRKLLVTLGILFIGFLYASAEKPDGFSLSNIEENSLQDERSEKQEDVHNALFVNRECELAASHHTASASRLPTRTLQQNVYQRIMMNIQQQKIIICFKIFSLRSTVFLKRQPFSKNFYIYYLNRITC